MYGWIWRHLPGPFVAKFLEALIAVAVIVLVLLFAVFPALSPHLPFNHVTVDTPAPSASPADPDAPAVPQ